MIWIRERSGQSTERYDDSRRVPAPRLGRRPCQRNADRVGFPLHLRLPEERPLSVLAIGADPDDIEIGAEG